MKHIDIRKKDELLYKIWEQYKNDYSMEELSNYFSIPLKTLYRIIKKEYDSRKKETIR